MEPLFSARLSVDYPGRPEVLREVALDIEAGEIVGLVGKSGSGKSTLALAALQLLAGKRAKARGSIRFDGRELLTLSEPEIRKVRGGEIGLVLQSPLASLNPALRIGTQLREAWSAHAPRDGKLWEDRVPELMASVSLPTDASFLERYPKQLSVGLAQRVLIASAIVHRPKLLLADEPTSALDAITSAEILDLFARLNMELGTAILYISHDLPSIASLCDRVAILNDGEIVEFGPTVEVFEDAMHPYTQRLVAAIPKQPWRLAHV